jgi:hypothetical protein
MTTTSELAKNPFMIVLDEFNFPIGIIFLFDIVIGICLTLHFEIVHQPVNFITIKIYRYAAGVPVPQSRTTPFLHQN